MDLVLPFICSGTSYWWISLVKGESKAWDIHPALPLQAWTPSWLPTAMRAAFGSSQEEVLHSTSTLLACWGQLLLFSVSSFSSGLG